MTQGFGENVYSKYIVTVITRSVPKVNEHHKTLSRESESLCNQVSKYVSEFLNIVLRTIHKPRVPTRRVRNNNRGIPMKYSRYL